MSNMKLLYELQNSYNNVEENIKIIKDGSHLYLLRKMKKEFGECKDKYNEKIKTINALKDDYAETSRELKEFRDKIDKDEYALYNNSSNDMKAINALQKSIKNNKAKHKIVEDTAIEHLEKEEKLNIDIENLKTELINVKNNFYSYKKDTSEKIEKAKINLEAANRNIEKLQKSISEEYLRAFYSKYEHKKNAVVKLTNGICGGCKMKVSAMTLDQITRKDKILYCDNCGRILIHEEVKNKKKTK